MTATLRTRPATGEPSIPRILVDGRPKSGRTVATIKLSEAPWVDRFFVVQIATTAYDDYGRHFPNVEILQHNGTISAVLDQIEAACAVKADDGKLNVVVVDDASEWWTTHKTLAETRQRRSKATRQRLAEDADAHIDVTPDKWNDVNAKWDRMFFHMLRSNVVGVFVCRGDDVMKMVNGRPAEDGETVYRVEARKTTEALTSMRVYVAGPNTPDAHQCRLMAVTSLDVVVPPAGLVLPDDRPGGPLAAAVEMVRPSAGKWHDGAALVEGQGSALTIVAAKNWVIAEIQRLAPKRTVPDLDAARRIAADVWSATWLTRGQPGAELSDDEQDHMRATVPLIVERLTTGPVPITNVAPPDPAPEDQTPFEEPEPGPAMGGASSNDQLCPECGQARHLGPCGT